MDDGYLTGQNSHLRTVRLNLKFPGPGGFFWKRGFRCDWKLDGPKGVEEYQHKDCKAFHVELALNYDYKISVIVKKKEGEVHRNENLTLKIKDFLIVSVGDSFGSGEGNPHTYFPNLQSKSFSKRPPMWLDPRCHRSLFSSSIQATRILALDHKSHSFSIANFACSGAESGSGLLKKYTGRSSRSQVAQMWIDKRTEGIPKNHFEWFKGYGLNKQPRLTTLANENSKDDPAESDIPSQIEQLSAALGCNKRVCQRRPDALLIYIGVNDIGFSKRLIEILTGCIKEKPKSKKKIKCKKDALDAVTKGLISTGKNLKTFSKELIERGIISNDHPTTVYAVTYPNPLTRPKGRYRKGYDLCGTKHRTLGKKNNIKFLGGLASMLGFRIKEFGAKFARDNIVFPLNKTLRDFVISTQTTLREDSPGTLIKWDIIENEQLMLGHGFCADNRYFNTFWDSQYKQGSVPRDYLWDNSECTDIKDNSCKVSRSLPLPSGAMHPNYEGHRKVALKINIKLKQQFELE